jgi:hypothetical protein
MAISKISAPLIFGVGLLLVLTAAMVGWMTRHGVGFPMDAMYYTSAARTEAAGGSMLVPDCGGGMEVMSHYPPFYPATLAAFSKITGDALPSARWLNMLLFPLDIFLLACLGRRMGLADGALLVICGLFALAPDLMLTYVSVRSEALVLPWWILGLWLLLEYHERQAPALLAGAAAAAACAMLTRYVGVALGGAGAVYVFFGTRGRLGRKLACSLAYFLTAVLPTAAWMFTHRGGMTMASRQLGFYGLNNYQYAKFLGAFARWVLPLNGMYLAKAIYIVVAVALFFALAVQIARAGGRPALFWQPERVNRSAVYLLLLNLAAYETVVFLTGIFLDPVQDVSSRMQIPPFVFVLLLLGLMASALARANQVSARAPVRRAATALVALLLLGYMTSAVVWLRGADNEALGNNDAQIRESPLVARVRERYAGAPIYTNNAEWLYFFTGRTDFCLAPTPRAHAGDAVNPDFPAEMAKMVADLAARNGVILYFKDVQPKMQTVAEIEATPGIHIVEDYPEAVILGPAKVN